MNEEKGGELRDINVKEVSIVDAPANRRKWLFFKSDLKKAKVKFNVESDGTLSGTKVTVNGEEVEDLKSFYFNYFKPDRDEELYIDPISCSYTVIGDADDGFESLTYNLTKAEGKLKMDYAKLGAFIKALTGKEITEEQLKKLDETALGQLNVLSQYEGQMPVDLSKAVGHFLKFDVEPSAEIPPDKPADKPAESEDLPADKLAELMELRDKLDALITGKKPEPEDATAEILKKIKGIAERIDTLEKGEKPATEPEDEPPDKGSGTKEILELLKAIDNRLGVVEKSSGIEKGAPEGGRGVEEPEVDNYKSIDL